MMNFRILLAIVVLTFSSSTQAYIWTEAVPTEIHIVPFGMIVYGDFNLTGVTCATSRKGIFVDRNDLHFDSKVSTAMMAKSMGLHIRVLINDPLESSCATISAAGRVPIAYYYYWQLRN